MNLHNRDRRRGITGVWVALMGSLMLVFLGLAIDTSYVVRTIEELQIAADSAALAGAAQVKADIDLARAQAKLLAFNNTAGMTNGVRDKVVLALNSTNDTAGDIVTGRWYRWDDNTTDPPRYAGDFVETTVLGEINALKVVARRINDTDTDPEAPKTALPLLFGSLFGWATVDLEVDAIAMSVGTTGAGLLVLCPDCACSLEFSGDTSMTLTTVEGYDGDASIVVDSNATGCNHNAAVCGHGSALDIDAQEINVVAYGPEYACFNDNAIVPPLNPGTLYVPDPLKDLPEPTINYAADRGCIGTSGCVKLCDAGPSVGSSCVFDTDCPDGLCKGGLVACEGGFDEKPPPGYSCMDNEDCPVGELCKLVPLRCYEGANAGALCIGTADCPGGLCLKTVRARSGYYSGGFRTTSANSNLILDPGVYSLDNVEPAGPSAGLVVRGGHFDA
ncbi:MAG: pilus assembly protein TadG-related protein, partial [Planctomycetota bacterium]|nr:pilus assembly protein TadG-related protein [Planctomycetota bacterium]